MLEKYLFTTATIILLIGGSSCYILMENGRQYHFHRTLRSWRNARHVCEKEYASLFIPDEPMEMTYIADLFGDTPDPLISPFIGFNDIDMTGGEYGYQSGEYQIPGIPFDDKAAMSPSGGPDISYVPNSGTANYCGVLRGIGAGAAAYHVEWELCTSRHSFICERPYTPQGLNIIIKPFKHVIKKVWAGLFD